MFGQWLSLLKQVKTTKKRMWIWILILLGLSIAALVLPNRMARSAGSVAGGVVDKGLRACGESPNCVCSCDARSGFSIEAFPGNAAIFDRLVDVIRADSRATIVKSSENYLHVEFTTTVFRFIDDAEFLHRPDTQTIEVRSASRLGWSDLGANRRRIERLRKQLSGE